MKSFITKIITPIIITHHQVTSFSTNSIMSSNKVISITNAGYQAVNGIYYPKSASIIPVGFDRTCISMNWNTQQMWNQLSDQTRTWYESENDSYIYWNKGDGKYWIDGPSGAGIYIVKDSGQLPPKTGWISLDTSYEPLPTVEVLDKDEL